MMNSGQEDGLICASGVSPIRNGSKFERERVVSSLCPANQ
jgi:hypothetical protein